MVQTITAVEACTAARKAYTEGRLLAQCTVVEVERIEYGYQVDIVGTKFVCGIGACLTQHSLDAIAGEKLGLTTIENDLAWFNNIFNYASGDYPVINELQRSHDSWLMSRIEGRNEIVVEDNKMRFLSIIQDVLGADDG